MAFHVGSFRNLHFECFTVEIAPSNLTREIEKATIMFHECEIVDLVKKHSKRKC